jgi:formyl-CoA transferase
VQTAEDIFADPQVAARGMLMTIHDPEVGDYQFARSPLHLSAAPELPKSPAPSLGQHTRYVLQDILGYSGDQVAGLAKEGVIGLSD